MNWRIGPGSEDIGHADYVARRVAAAGLALRPLSPVHVRGTRTATGDLVLTWVRRTRVSGDAWEIAEVPLGEAAEAYEVDILAAGVTKRTLRTVTPVATYAAADQIADFGGLQNAVAVRVVQMSALVGRGGIATATV